MSSSEANQRTFGPVVEPKSKRIIGIYARVVDVPDRVLDFLYSIGQPVYRNSESGWHLWRLKHSEQYYSDQWQWLYSAIEWHCADKLDFEWKCDIEEQWFEESDLPKDDGPLLDMTSHSEAGKLISAYRAYRERLAKGEDHNAKHKITGHQRIMYRTWAELEESDLKPVARLTLLVILRKCWSRSQCTLDLTEISRLVGCDKRTIQRSGITPLVKDKWIKVTNTFMERNTYTILRKELIPPYPKNDKPA